MLHTILMILPFAVVIIIIIGALGRSIAEVWVRHRVQMTLLEKLEERPDLLDTFQEIQEELEDKPGYTTSPWKPDFVQTGAALALVGIVCALAFSAMGRSQFATAAYFGGVMCVCLGFILAVIGLLVRYLSHNPSRHFKE
ncbi:MAG: hypothetical protein ACLFTT_05425 [Candidatus Hydrogenedentota bacterium]